MSTRERVVRIVSEVLGRPVASVDDDSSPDNIESWDSLKQMNLVLALEQEFGIRFTDEQIVEMLSVRLIVAAVAKFGSQASSDSER